MTHQRKYVHLESSRKLYGRALGYGRRRYYPGYMSGREGCTCYVITTKLWSRSIHFYRGVCVDAVGTLRGFILQRGRRRILRAIKIEHEVRAITEVSEWSRGNVGWLPGCEPD